MRQMKYIIISYIDCTYSDTKPVLVPVTFPPILVHKDMADRVKHCLSFNKLHTSEHKTISAGFIDMETLKVFGKSESLNLKSRPEDSSIIRDWLTLYAGVSH